jgi:uncharacterized protein YjbI with pentapeptide repeats
MHMARKKISRPEDLDGLDKEGLIAFLKGDQPDKIALWNDWRKVNDWAEIDLAQADLRTEHLEGIDLSLTHLERSEFIYAHLEMANLNGVHLEGATLLGAHLEDAKLTTAYLEAADLRGTHLERAFLRGAHLEKAALNGTLLDGAFLSKAHLEEAILSRARLEGTDLTQAFLRDTDLSGVASLRGVKLYQTYFWGVLSLRYEQFLDEEGRSTIWEHTEGRFSEAKDVYKTLKGYFEDAGDYKGANWAYGQEQEMEKLMFAPPAVRWLYPRWKGKWQPDEGGNTFWKPAWGKWVGLEISDRVAGYGMSLVRPVLTLGVVILLFALLYLLADGVTAMSGCGYVEAAANPIAGCLPTGNPIDYVWFSLGAITGTQAGTLRAYREYVWLIHSLEMFFGIALTGLIGFVLGNKLRFS